MSYTGTSSFDNPLVGLASTNTSRTIGEARKKYAYDNNIIKKVKKEEDKKTEDKTSRYSQEGNGVVDGKDVDYDCSLKDNGSVKDDGSSKEEERKANVNAVLLIIISAIVFVAPTIKPT